MAVLTLVCLVVPVLLIRSALLGVRGLGDAGSKAGEAVVASVRSVAEAFRTGKIETSLRSYATQMRGVSRFEFAELKQLEAYKSLGTVFGNLSPGIMLGLTEKVSATATVGILLMTERDRASEIILAFQPSIGLAIGL